MPENSYTLANKLFTRYSSLSHKVGRTLNPLSWGDKDSHRQDRITRGHLSLGRGVLGKVPKDKDFLLDQGQPCWLMYFCRILSLRLKTKTNIFLWDILPFLYYICLPGESTSFYTSPLTPLKAFGNNYSEQGHLRQIFWVSVLSLPPTCLVTLDNNSTSVTSLNLLYAKNIIGDIHCLL